MYRSIQLQGEADTSAIETRELQGSEYIVFPVVGLMGDIVIRPMGSTGNEFVPSSVIVQGAPSFNNRPVVMGHPEVSGNPVSANDPLILESWAFGDLFNSHAEDGNLILEAWLRAELAKDIDDAEDVITRAAAGEPVSVSIGANVIVIERRGLHKGEEYQFVWEQLIGDHLAVFNRAGVGACSIADGCKLTVAGRYVDIANWQATSELTKTGVALIGTPKESTMIDSLPKAEQAKVLARRELMLHGEESDQDIQGRIFNALEQVIPGFNWIGPYYLDQGVVQYDIWMNNDISTWQTTFDMTDNEVTIGDERIELQFAATWIPKNNARGEVMCTDAVVALIDTIVDTEDSGFTDNEADRATLGRIPESALAVMAGVKVDGATSEPPTDIAKVEIPAKLYESLQAAALTLDAQHKEAREKDIKTLGANPMFTTTFLAGQSDDQLHELASSYAAVRSAKPAEFPGTVTVEDKPEAPVGVPYLHIPTNLSQRKRMEN